LGGSEVQNEENQDLEESSLRKDSKKRHAVNDQPAELSDLGKDETTQDDDSTMGEENGSH